MPVGKTCQNPFVPRMKSIRGIQKGMVIELQRSLEGWADGMQAERGGKRAHLLVSDIPCDWMRFHSIIRCWICYANV